MKFYYNSAMENETTAKSQQTYIIKKVIAIAAILLAGVILFAVYPFRQTVKRKEYNKQLLEHYKEKYRPEVRSIIVLDSVEEMIADLKEHIKNEEEEIRILKEREESYFPDLPEEIKRIRFADNEEAFEFFYSAIKKIIYDLENDPSIDGRKKQKEFDAIMYYLDIYMAYARIEHHENMIEEAKKDGIPS